MFNRSFRLSDYLQAVKHVELEQSVHVEADVDEPFLLQETRMILALAEQDNPIQGVVAGGRPEKDGFQAYLDLNSRPSQAQRRAARPAY